jgi:tRNA (guanine37-N1)-methyltransferase
MRLEVITIFPELFEPFFRTSILRIAREAGFAKYRAWDLRDFSDDRHRKVDERPFGGGPGMVFTPGPVFRAVEHVASELGGEYRLVMTTPQGRRFDQKMAGELAEEEALILLAGHYEGFDERIRLGLRPLEISLGDFVLTGGEVPAMAILDAVVRLLPGVLGNEDSGRQDSFRQGLLGFPQYTRPRVFRNMAVPDVLLCGDHSRIAEWRVKMARERTRERRADLLKGEDDANRG